ncbi:hypothetical protein KKD37_01210 [Patescibacteria group bacterium]|nr:hypothetical protein [Patescibacteria group bacterium]
MVVFLNILQGLISLLVVIGALTGWPVWFTIIGLIGTLAISLVIVLLREESGKDPLREIIEGVSGFVFGIGGLLFWSFSVDNPSLIDETPWGFVFTAAPSFIFNLGPYLAWVLKVFATALDWAAAALEWVAGWEVGGG